MNNLCCTRCGSACPDVLGFVANETKVRSSGYSSTDPDWSPTRLALLTGSGAGTFNEGTDLAESLSVPQRAYFNCLYVIATLAVAVVAIVGTQIGHGLLTAINEVNDQSSGSRVDIVEQAVYMTYPIVGVVWAIVTITVYIFTLTFSRLRFHQTQAGNKLERRFSEAEMDIYKRLGYCESEHVVFDPVSGYSCIAICEDVLNMINLIRRCG